MHDGVNIFFVCGLDLVGLNVTRTFHELLHNRGKEEIPDKLRQL